jgi:hypothetical protein
MPIPRTVFGNRVVDEKIIQTGPGDTTVTLTISGSAIPKDHVQRLLRSYQAHYDRGFVDLTITSDDDSVHVRANPVQRAPQPGDHLVIRDAIMSLQPTYPDIECGLGSDEDGTIAGIRVHSQMSATIPQFQFAVHNAIAQTGIAVPPVIFSTQGF